MKEPAYVHVHKSLDYVNLWSCSICGGLVVSQERHTSWHRRLDDTLRGVAVAAAEGFEIPDDGPYVPPAEGG